MKTGHRIFRINTFSCGSALILTVVLTSLLAIVGVLFVMVSRVDKMATSAISENKELDFAVEAIVARISQELVLDVPGVAGQEYYDYPDANNAWLAVLEPYGSGGNYYWRHISDLYNKLDQTFALRAEVVPDYQDAGVMDEGVAADADGDGVADSKWVVIPDVHSGKGKPIYAAVRVIDNGAMLNVNTAYKFNPADPTLTVFGKSGPGQLQINLLALAGRTGDPPTLEEEATLLMARANNGIGVNPLDMRRYEDEVIWSYDQSSWPYTPFDISDELELRYRFMLNHTAIVTRLEDWGSEFRKNTLSTPVTSGGGPLDIWSRRAGVAGGFDPNYAYRHIATTYNMDRVINPLGSALNSGRMVNVNTADASLIYAALRAGILDGDPNSVAADRLAAQLAVNIIDLRDFDAEVTVLSTGSGTYYGLEAQPFISEIAFRISGENADVSANNYFAVELYNPLDTDIPLDDFRLEVRRQTGELVGTVELADFFIPDASQFVVTNGRDASIDFDVVRMIGTGGIIEDPDLVLAEYRARGTDPETYELRERYDIFLIRSTSGGDIYLDKQQTQDEWLNWDTVRDVQQFYGRADNDWNVVYQSMVSTVKTLGAANGLSGGRRDYNFHNFAAAFGRFASVGDIARAFTVGPGTDPNGMIGMQLASQPAEGLVRLDLQNPAFENIFQYLTVLDPVSDYIDNDGDGLGIDSNGNTILDANEIDEDELKVPGRVNVNTAPWFVVAQLPWMESAVAQGIVTYRDTIASGFKSIAGLIQVPEMRLLGADGLDNLSSDIPPGPDLTPDTARDDFEERDVIFSRISNIVTVRSDVFTAYILVRVGAGGPQKRVLAILDRSNVYSGSDKVKVIALHPVPDPR